MIHASILGLLVWKLIEVKPDLFAPLSLQPSRWRELDLEYLSLDPDPLLFLLKLFGDLYIGITPVRFIQSWPTIFPHFLRVPRPPAGILLVKAAKVEWVEGLGKDYLSAALNLINRLQSDSLSTRPLYLKLPFSPLRNIFLGCFYKKNIFYWNICSHH